MESHVQRPTGGRVLAVSVWVICAAGAVALAVSQGPGVLVGSGAWLLLPAVAVWAVFYRPGVAVDDGGVELVNVLRTVRLPWPSIQRVDTRWSLTLHTAYGKFSAWAAPAPGRYAARRDQRRRGGRASADEGGIRLGDLPDSESGAAAESIRRRWEALRDAGHLDDPRLEFDRAPTRWHLGTILALVALLVWALLNLAGVIR
ncbi:PH domain-containing protein [Nakamurella flavida]|uniref:PH domain-containing protein n=1 Tax=Nakamurella flavida TaxID=363630 RepID=A0A938YJ57_9ACTN|nr:PH domain-containing protein [Nakamurella flavida]MBM9476947.1 PH domain-containing protein [Nakamurella flavida]MDP9779892.1 hypothetical protein [Nakamurella flavida]